MLEQEPRPHTWEALRDAEEPHRLAAFLRTQREALLADWQRSTHALHARRAGESSLVDHIPSLLDGITEALAHEVSGMPLQLPSVLSDVHAFSRLAQGFSIHELTYEYGLLRRCILLRLEAAAIHPGPGTLALLDELIDQAVTRSVQSYSKLRERMLNSLDRMMQATLDSPDVDTLLSRLLALMMEAALQVDKAFILLREDGALRVHAAMGGEAERTVGMSLRIGEGFAGRVAAERKPLAVRMEGTEPADGSAEPAHAGLRVLYGIPMLDGEHLVGVAYMGSRTVYAFSEADTLLLRTMVSRATALIVQAQLRAQEQSAREEAERSLAMVDALLAGSPVGIAFMDRNLRYVRINETLAQVNGMSAQEHLGRTAREVLDPRVADLIEGILQRVLHTGEPSMNLEFETPEGVDRLAGKSWLASYFPVRTASGAIVGVGGVLTDITAHKRAEKSLEKDLVFREQLLAVLGHDLRNPLGAISACAFLLARSEGLDAREKQAVERIRRSGARMARLIDDILDFARSRMGGGIPVTRQRMNMAEVCRATLEELQVTFPERQLVFEAQGDLCGEWDPDRVAQVLSNLVFNALQHGHPDTPVSTRLRSEGDQVLLQVHNHGQPVPAQLLPHLFDPFKRRPEDQRPHEGKSGIRSLGLGLHIVQQIALAHGGTVEVRSTAEEGTRFTVRWPRVPV
ncbi:MAG TPA: ATP-binding protein [Myxococcaceae bacterium]|jgi:PAS domain S-box-containing protein